MFMGKRVELSCRTWSRRSEEANSGRLEGMAPNFKDMQRNSAENLKNG
jgi:hypothetical protein